MYSNRSYLLVCLCLCIFQSKDLTFMVIGLPIVIIFHVTKYLQNIILTNAECRTGEGNHTVVKQPSVRHSGFPVQAVLCGWSIPEHCLRLRQALQGTYVLLGNFMKDGHLTENTCGQLWFVKHIKWKNLEGLYARISRCAFQMRSSDYSFLNCIIIVAVGKKVILLR